MQYIVKKRLVIAEFCKRFPEVSRFTLQQVKFDDHSLVYYKNKLKELSLLVQRDGKMYDKKNQYVFLNSDYLKLKRSWSQKLFYIEKFLEIERELMSEQTAESVGVLRLSRGVR